MKDKHIKLKLGSRFSDIGTPRCHPERREPRTENWKKSITYDALGWHMAERAHQVQLLPGDALDIAFSLDQNDHSDFGGLELSLRDFRKQMELSAA